MRIENNLYDKGNLEFLYCLSSFYCLAFLLLHINTSPISLQSVYLHIARGLCPLHTGKYFKLYILHSPQSQSI